MENVVSVVWYKVLPAKYGGQKVITLFNEYLANHFSVTCLCSYNNEPKGDEPYSIIADLSLSKLQFVNPLCWVKILKLVSGRKAKYLIIEHPYHGLTGFLAKKLLGVKLIIHSHNIEFLRFKEQKKRGWRLLGLYEKWAHQRADLSVFTSEEDQLLAVEQFGILPEKCIVVPYCIEKKLKHISKTKAREFLNRQYNILPDEKILLFAGTLDYLPNAEAVEYIYKEIAPRLAKNRDFQFKIIICGRNRFKEFHYLNTLKHENVIMAGEVDDVDILFTGADVFINPVQQGGGIQTKNIDALNANLSVVCFEHMLQGIPLKVVNGNLLIAERNNWNNFTDKIIIWSNSPPLPKSQDFFDYFNRATVMARFTTSMKQL